MSGHAERQPSRIGRYEIESRIGRGGMATVYLARDPAIGRAVAVKLLRVEGDEVVERFRREAQSAGRLTHPNLVTIFDVGEDEGQPFIAMEYVAGRTLADLVHSERPTLGRALEIVEGVADGLAFAHRAGVVHRDVKPANVIVTDDGTPKLLDFGVAQLAAPGVHDTAAGTIIGTPNYMAPEQVKGHRVDARVDVFALGVILYELVAGRRPFEGELVTVLHQIVSQEPPRLSSLVPGVPPPVDEIARRCLAKSPDDRYQTMTEVALAIADARRGLAVAAPDAHPTPVVAVLPPPPALPGSDTVHLSPGNAPPSASGLAATAEDPPVHKGDSTVLFGPQPGPRAQVDARLVVQTSPDARLEQATFTLTERTFEIGREGHDLRSAERGWSRRHACIERTDAGFVIRDLGSTNGTYVNGRLVRGTEPLFFGARIAIGQTILTFSAAQALMLPDLAGCEIEGRYVLESLIRESPRASVYAARLKRLPKRVAVKLMAPRLLEYPGYRERFRREAEIASALMHPNIRTVEDYGEATIAAAGATYRTEFVCFPLAAGGSLADVLDGREPIEAADALRWTEQLGAALDYAHGQQVLHGDLKPSVVLFDASHPPNAYLSDFTIGATTSDSGLVIGSPAYMAPELWDATPPTPATDQFGLAVLAYCMLTGVRPFEGQDNPVVRRRNFARGPMPAHEEAAQKDRQLPPAVSEVLARALEASPGARYGSVGAFVAALRDALTGAPTADGPAVFLSYQRGANAGWATFIADRLREKHGLDVFLDVERVDAASRFPERLSRAIRGCQVFVCMLGPTTLDSPWVLEEIRLAGGADKAMIPVFLEGFVPAPRPADDPVRALLLYDGIRLLDQQNLFVKHAVDELAQRVLQTIADRQR